MIFRVEISNGNTKRTFPYVYEFSPFYWRYLLKIYENSNLSEVKKKKKLSGFVREYLTFLLKGKYTNFDL